MRWSAAGTPQDLVGIAGIGRDNQNQVRAINDAGQVAGIVGSTAAFRFSAGTMEQLTAINGPSWLSEAFGINGSGQVVGQSTAASP